MCRIEFLPVFKPDEFYCVERFKENRRMANPHYQQRVSVVEATATAPEVPEWVPHTPDYDPEPLSTSEDESVNGSENAIIDLT